MFRLGVGGVVTDAKFVLVFSYCSPGVSCVVIGGEWWCDGWAS